MPEEQTQETGPSERLKQLSRVAQERLGPKYQGGLLAEAVNEPEKDEDELPAETENETAEAESDTGETQNDPPEDTGSEEPEKQDTVSRWPELIETQEWDPDWAQSLRMPIKVDGQEGEVTIRDLVDSYEPKEAAQRRLTEAKEKARTTIEQAEALANSIQEQHSHVEALLKKVEQQFEADSNIDWQKFEDEEGADKAALKKIELRERREAIEKLKQEAEETRNRQVKEQEEARKQQLAELARNEFEKFKKDIQKVTPEFVDPEKAKPAAERLVKYMHAYGLSNEEINGILDSRILIVTEKARLYDEMMSKRTAAKKKIAAVPKVMKPGASKQVDNSGLKKSEERFKKAPSLDSAVELLKARRAKQNSG